MKQAIDLVSPKREAKDDITENKRCRTTRAAAAAAANKIRNGLIDLASPIQKENAKEPADLGLGVNHSNGKKERLTRRG